MTHIFLRLVLAVVVALLMGFSAVAQKTGVRLYVPINADDVPAAVRTAFKAAYPKAKVRACFREEENGELSYEIESTDAHLRRDILYNSDGSVRKIEERITIADLPAEAQQTLREKYSKAGITTIEKITQGDSVSYEVNARQGKQVIQIGFDANGKLLSSHEVIIKSTVGFKK